ncbi:phage protein [Bordetella avium 197N]|uniref:Phage protein n=1 Tax=Bordetella avium (strain 197N) TaxID=360910 RepID=Q2L2I9_BORA1|nr:phage protein [Bordetella avium 197N]
MGAARCPARVFIFASCLQRHRPADRPNRLPTHRTTAVEICIMWFRNLKAYRLSGTRIPLFATPLTIPPNDPRSPTSSRTNTADHDR